jgi:membrane-associated phospholipid phosphatase
MNDSIQIGRAAAATWIIFAVVVAALAIGCVTLGFSIAWQGATSLIAVNLFLVGGAFIIRQRGWIRLANSLIAVAQMALLAAGLMYLSYILASTNAPLADARLIEIDRSFGFDWRAVVGAMMAHPTLMMILNYAYASFNYQLTLLIPLLFLTGYGRQGAELVLAWAIALSVTIAVFPFLPAAAGFLHFGIEPRDVPLVWVHASWAFADLFYAAREGALQVLELEKLDGIVTFPSFHAAVAIMLAWACRDVPYLRGPILVLNGLMWVSAIPIGGHYATDIVAGSALAVAAIVAARAIMMRNPLPRPIPDPVTAI